jgi:hypothetical protein
MTQLVAEKIIELAKRGLKKFDRVAFGCDQGNLRPIRNSRHARRFPPPWSIEETDACFVVLDHNGQKLAYVTPFALLGCVSLIFHPIPQPAVNDLPLVVANRTEIEQVRPFFL